MDFSGEQRAAPRISCRVPVGYAAGQAGRGMTANVSDSGALICEATNLVAAGTRLIVAFGVRETSSISVHSEVVRQTADGFAVRFLDPFSIEDLGQA